MERRLLLRLLSQARRYARARLQGKPSARHTTVRLPEGPRAHVKFWAPRRLEHRLMTLFRKTRIEREGTRHARLMDEDVRVPELVLWGVRRWPVPRFGLYEAGLILTRYIEGGKDLAKLLEAGEPPWEVNGRCAHAEVLDRLGRLVASTHNKGIVHGDFMLKNVVYSPTDDRLWLIDLGSWRSSWRWSLRPGSRFPNDLLRMVLSLARKGLHEREVLTFLDAYLRERGVENAPAGGPRACLRACLAVQDRRADEMRKLLLE